MNTKKKSILDEYVEVLFDDIQDNSTSAALWLHANDGPEGCVSIFRTLGGLKRHNLFIKAFATALRDDPHFMHDVTQAVALSLTPRDHEDRDDLDDILDDFINT
jgi:hypothetical protein